MNSPTGIERKLRAECIEVDSAETAMAMDAQVVLLHTKECESVVYIYRRDPCNCDVRYLSVVRWLNQW